MTSTPFTSDVHNADGHPDVAEISDLTEDLLTSGPRGGRPTASGRLRALRATYVHPWRRSGLARHASGPGADARRCRRPHRCRTCRRSAARRHRPSNALAVSRETRRASRERSRRTKPGREAAAPKHAAAAVSRETSLLPCRCARALDRPALRSPRGCQPPGTAPSRQAYTTLALRCPVAAGRSPLRESAVSSCSP